MKAIDTNILIRFFMQDDPGQCKIVDRLFDKAEKSNERLWVSNIVVLEMILVLEKYFKVVRNDIIQAVESLACLSFLSLEDSELITMYCQMASSSNLELADLFIGLKAQACCDYTWTFDKKATKSKYFKLLK